MKGANISYIVADYFWLWLGVLGQSFSLAFSIVFEDWRVLLVAVLGFIVTAVVKFRQRGRSGVKGYFRSALAGAQTVAIVFGLVFIFSIPHTIAKNEAEKQHEILRKENAELREKLNKKPTVVTKTIPTPPEARKCHWYQYSFSPDPVTSAGATHATQVILFCNQRTEAPLYIGAKFNAEIIQHDITVLNQKISMGKEESHGGIVEKTQDSPSVPAYKPVVIVAWAKEKIRATQAVMKTIE